MTELQRACYGLSKHYLQAVEGNRLLHKQVVTDWQAMQQAASQDGLRLALVSSYRDFHRQAAIWNAKFSGERPVLDDQDQPVALETASELEKIEAIQRFSAMPGTSRHHWGSDIDLYAPDAQTSPLQLLPSEYLPGGPQYAIGCWLAENARRFGFFLPYQQDLGGVSIEPWHLSHHTTSEMMHSQWQLSTWLELIRQQQVAGWQTIQLHAEQLIERFVQRINYE